MNPYYTMYWFVKLDDIRGFLTFGWDFIGGISFLLIVLGIFGCAIALEKQFPDNFKVPLIKILKKGALAWFLFIAFVIFPCNIVSTFLPSTKQMAYIYVGGSAFNSETTQIMKRLPKKFALLLEQKANEWADEQLKPKEVVENETEESN